MKQLILIASYLAAIIVANLLTTAFGPGVSVLNAFLFIGLDITTRDYLHEMWKKKLWVKMACLVASGSLLSWLVNKNAGMIAIASFSAFAIAGLVDTIIYSVLKERAFLLKVNGSNVASALVDSITFPTIAFGSVLPWIMLGQFMAKVGGGFVWSIVLRKLRGG